MRKDKKGDQVEEAVSVLITGNKAERNAINYLILAVTKDKTRPILGGVFVDGPNAMAANGFVLHIVPTPKCLKPFDGKVVKLGKLTIIKGAKASDEKYFVATAEVVEGDFPDYTKIARINHANFQIGVDLGLLRNAIDKNIPRSPLSSFGLITLQEPYSPIIIQSSTPERHPGFGRRRKRKGNKIADEDIHDDAYMAQRLAVVLPMHEAARKLNPFLSDSENGDLTYSPVASQRREVETLLDMINDAFPHYLELSGEHKEFAAQVIKVRRKFALD